MTDPRPMASATASSTRPAFTGGEVTVDVNVYAPAGHLHPAALLNAAAVAVDTALRATDETHPAHHRSDQCGRTFLHESHDTTAGRCAGLDGTEVPVDPERPTLLDALHEPIVIKVDLDALGHIGLIDLSSQAAERAAEGVEEEQHMAIIAVPEPHQVRVIGGSASGVLVVPLDRFVDADGQRRPLLPLLVDPNTLRRVIDADATQPGAYGRAVRDTLVALGLVESYDAFPPQRHEGGCPGGC